MDTPQDTKPKSSSTNSSPIRLSKPTARQLRSLVSKCNRKSHGRRVKADDVIAKSISILQDSHLEEIKASTYSSQDQLEIEFKKYCQTHGNISKDAFLKLLLTQALPQVNEPEATKDHRHLEQSERSCAGHAGQLGGCKSLCQPDGGEG